MHANMLTPLVFAAAASAAVITIQVGPNGDNVYNSNSVTANVGDTVVFDFVNTNHNVVQGSLSSVCQPLGGGFYSGYPSAVGQGFAINITSTDPIWYYCSKPGHCRSGMAGVINPPSGSSISDYTSKAASVANAGTPSVNSGTGGQLGTASALAAAASSSNSGSTTSSAVSSASSSAMSAVASASSSAASAVASASSAAMSASSAGGSAASSASSVLSSVTHSASSAISAAVSSASKSASSSASSAAAVATQVPVAVLAVAGLAALL